LLQQIALWPYNYILGKIAMIFLLLAVLSGSAAVLFYDASREMGITPWAADVCSASQLFCNHPEWLAYGAGGMIALFLVWKLANVG
jgi:hypothetical protein